MHWYVFTHRGWDAPVFERTFPDRTLAYRWLDGSKHEGFVLCNLLPAQWYY